MAQILTIGLLMNCLVQFKNSKRMWESQTKNKQIKLSNKKTINKMQNSKIKIKQKEKKKKRLVKPLKKKMMSLRSFKETTNSNSIINLEENQPLAKILSKQG